MYFLWLCVEWNLGLIGIVLSFASKDHIYMCILPVLALMPLTYSVRLFWHCSVMAVLHDVALLKGFEQGCEPAASNELSCPHHSLSNSVYPDVGMSPHLST